MPFTEFSVGSVEDDLYCLIKENDTWVVGTGERGRFYPRAWFRNEVEAARYMILLLLGGVNRTFMFPALDWTGYASLPSD